MKTRQNGVAVYSHDIALYLHMLTNEHTNEHTHTHTHTHTHQQTRQIAIPPGEDNELLQFAREQSYMNRVFNTMRVLTD